MPAIAANRPAAEAQAIEAMVRYYSEAGPDYAAWSPAFNMHFGYFERGLNPFDREAMLECMNRRVTRDLENCRHVVDLGCGLGATARSLAARSPETKVTGVTVVPWQVQKAAAMTPPGALVDYAEDDYTSTRFPDRTFDGAYAIESFCHGPGRAKAACILEASRILKPGGRFVIADGFLKTSSPLNPFLAACHRRICECWAMDSLPVLPEFLACLREAGFSAVTVDDVSWRVAPSVAQVPFVTLRFLGQQLLANGCRLSRERWSNLLAPFLTGIAGLARAHFGYYLVSAAAPS